MDCGYGDDWSVPGVAAVAAYARPVASLPSAACQEPTAFLNSIASVSPCGCPAWSRYGGRYLQLGRAERQGGREGGKGKEQPETSEKPKDDIPTYQVPAAEIVRARVGERNAKARGEEEELLIRIFPAQDSSPVVLGLWWFARMADVVATAQSFLVAAPKPGVLEGPTGTQSPRGAGALVMGMPLLPCMVLGTTLPREGW